VNYTLGWFSTQHVTVVDERIQADTYLACVILAETLGSMTGALGRDYVVERLEDVLDARLVNGYYRRLTLGPGQRFASKGGYLVRFAEPKGTQITADGSWLIP
jgi:hypothetical protein